MGGAFEKEMEEKYGEMAADMAGPRHASQEGGLRVTASSMPENASCVFLRLFAFFFASRFFEGSGCIFQHALLLPGGGVGGWFCRKITAWIKICCSKTS
jgi:hypothetical protein